MKVKPKKCKVCKNSFEPKQSFQLVCSYSCALSHVKQKEKERQDKQWKKEKECIKQSLKTLSEYESEAKKSFQKYIRLRDKDLPCISCGNTNPKDWCGSHYYPAGVYSGLIFDERNCHGACNTYCNKYLSGNLINYRIGLIMRYGESFVLGLESEAASKYNYKYTKEELIEIKRKYDLKIKEFKH